MCYYFDDIGKIKDFDFDIYCIKSHTKNILVYDVSCKSLIGARRCILGLIK